MNQQPSAEAQAQPETPTPQPPRAAAPSAQPSVGSIAAHRPQAVRGTVPGLEPDLDADPDAYEDEGVVGADGEELPGDRFLDRERSWLAFNERVLELAEDPATPSSNGRTFLRFSPATWTSSSWSGWPDSSDG